MKMKLLKFIKQNYHYLILYGKIRNDNFVDGQAINRNKIIIPPNPVINTNKINIIKSLIILVSNDKKIIKLYSQGYNDSTKLKN